MKNRRHYYAMHTPYGNVVDTNNTPVGTVIIFDGKKIRDEWAEANEYNTRNGNKHQTKVITQHEARVIMLRQHGREMFEYHNDNLRMAGRPLESYGDYREYAQFCPTAIMARDYGAIVQ